MSLDDMTKVYYLHDYLYGEFGEEYEEDRRHQYLKKTLLKNNHNT